MLTIAVLTFGFTACSQTQKEIKKSKATNTESQAKEKPNEKILNPSLKLRLTPADWNELTAAEARIIVNKGTEPPFSGIYVNNKEAGTYLCKRCNQTLFTSESKFKSGTGWPSFDDMIEDHVEVVTDKDGMRSEIICSNCKGHLGHVFYGEGFTDKSTRHCVNSLSLNFVKK